MGNLQLAVSPIVVDVAVFICFRGIREVAKKAAMSVERRSSDSGIVRIAHPGIQIEGDLLSSSGRVLHTLLLWSALSHNEHAFKCGVL